MSKQKFYHFETDNKQEALIRAKFKHATNNQGDVYAVVSGADKNFAVVDLKTAIELTTDTGGGYIIP
jgi:hypothetical protein